MQALGIRVPSRAHASERFNCMRTARSLGRRNGLYRGKRPPGTKRRKMADEKDMIASSLGSRCDGPAGKSGGAFVAVVGVRAGRRSRAAVD